MTPLQELGMFLAGVFGMVLIGIALYMMPTCAKPREYDECTWWDEQ